MASWCSVALVGTCLFVSSSVALGCGGAGRSPTDASEESVEARRPAATTRGADAVGSDPAAGDVTEPSTQGPPGGAGVQPAESPPTSQSAERGGDRAPARDVKYLMSPDGLRVEVEGVVFVPTARAVRAGKYWSVQVQVEARSSDDKTHSLLVPKGAELAFAAKIRRADARTEELSDHRSDDTAVELTPTKTVRLARAFPAQGAIDAPAPLAEGDELKLEVGIWGVGADPHTRRPLNQLSTITFKFEKGKPRVKVAPPESVSR